MTENSKALKRRFVTVEENISDICKQYHSDRPELLAVSKGQESKKIQWAYELGYRTFGENYLSELVEKAEQLSELDIKWAFIGKIQSNKIKKMAKLCDEILTLSSIKQAKLLNKYAEEFNKQDFPVWICVNAAQEPQKSGCHPDDLTNISQFITSTCPALHLKGILAIPPKEYSDQDFKTPPQLYKDLRSWANSIGEGKLSLGMSKDIGIAIAAGSDMVRIGTDLFGPRANRSL